MKNFNELTKEEREKFGYPSDEELATILPFIEWAKTNVKQFIWSEAHCYSERLWTGGITDVGAELIDGTLAIIDFKSNKEVYASHFIQIAGYDLEIQENGIYDSTGTANKKVGTIGAYIVVPFGAKKVVPVVERDIEKYKRGFEACVSLYRLIVNNK